MPTFLLTWNPACWPWGGLKDAVEQTARGVAYEQPWSCGRRKNIGPGDEVFLIRLGREPRGIMGFGSVIGPPQLDKHWNPDRSDNIPYAPVVIDRVVDPYEDGVIPLSDLTATEPLSSVHWSTQSSGILIPDDSAAVLHQIWQRFIEEVDAVAAARRLFVPGKTYRRADLHERFGGQRQGGISTPAKHPIILLFTGESGHKYGYSDGFQGDGTFLYTGEGQVGDMQMTKGNKAIRDHALNGKTLHLFELIGDGRCQYMGMAQYAGHEDGSTDDINKKPRRAIIFELALESSSAAPRPPRMSSKCQAEPQGLWRKELAELRTLALQSASRTSSTIETKRNVQQRSNAVRVYVLKRSAGICEGCGRDAPFVDKQSRPYLEPHHLIRRADDGPDHPTWVAALCPNCHRRVHSGKDGDEFNADLINHIREKEVALQK